MTNPYTPRDLQKLGIVQLDTDDLNPIVVQVDGAVDTMRPLPVATSTNPRLVNATIASGAAESSVITLDPGERIVGIIMPATWTTANLVASVSFTGSGYQYAFSYGSAIQMFPVAGGTTQLDPVDADKLSRLPYVKLVSATASGSTVTTVNQEGERVLQVVVVSQ